MSKERNETPKEQENKYDGDGIAARVHRARRVHRLTRDPRAGIRAYCAGNIWLTENAKAVGNWR